MITDRNSSGAKKPKISILSILILSLFIGLIVGAGIDKSYILPVALVTAIILYVKRDKIAATDIQTPSSAKLTKPNHSTGSIYHWPESGQFNCAVDAKPYQKTIQQLIQENIAASDQLLSAQTRIFTAQLIPDLSNPFDMDIIRVEIHQQTIGHLYGEQARNFRNQLKENELSDQATCCKALITINNPAGDKPPHYSVMLDLVLPE
ncbi:hypothetical protein [Nitrosomonas sp.]|uniref:hypothetical protein n=1 Tax=Nitrosomonas sp. TaxID=42353 RepID=UPI001D9A5491|nr:hypothetical protein [Nitrosomonas sp.]MBX3616537.1 hypothetical protein [Nitrosomonas sp.]